jgi:transcriptional regulator with PAS, ATPase and Fis domain
MELQSLKQRFNIIGNSSGLNYALSVAERVAPTNLTVLITGESGVGKEIFSQVIHQLSPRKHNPFIAVNCGAIPEGTIDSELFGHEKGSFTGAHEARKGYFETVKDGTIFLDEIGEMPLVTQARLLRVLETGEFIRVGSSKVQKTDVRVVAATNVDLFEGIQRGKFREDLYYRLNTVPIKVPSLRERKEDIYVLFRKFATEFSEKNRVPAVQLDEAAQKVLTTYTWPGNIRELKNITEQVCILSKDKNVSAQELFQFIPENQLSKLPALSGSYGNTGNESLTYTERDLLYKFIFELKKDVTDLKKFIFEMAHNSNVQVPDYYGQEGNVGNASFSQSNIFQNPERSFQSIMLNKNEEAPTRVVEEPKSLADMEKDMITKSLAKHKNKRKNVAIELGISERTLYRKIKEYHIKE